MLSAYLNESEKEEMPTYRPMLHLITGSATPPSISYGRFRLDSRVSQASQRDSHPQYINYVKVK